jgi:hypothetical protein
MEPLVVFGAGLVAYCGWLAILDEIRVLKKWYERRAAAAGPARSRSTVRGVSVRKGISRERPRFVGGTVLPEPVTR